MRQADVKVGAQYMTTVNKEPVLVEVLSTMKSRSGTGREMLKYNVRRVDDGRLLAPMSAAALRPCAPPPVTQDEADARALDAKSDTMIAELDAIQTGVRPRDSATVREAHPEAFAGLPTGACAACGRVDVLTCEKTGEGTRLTYHDDPAGVRCAGGGGLPGTPEEVEAMRRDREKAAAFGSRYAQQGTVADMLGAAQPRDPTQVQDEVITGPGSPWPAAVEALPAGDIPAVHGALHRLRFGPMPAASFKRSQRAVLPAIERGGLARRSDIGSEVYELTPAGEAARKARVP